MLYNAGGALQPNSDVVNRLREISPLLELRHVRVPVAGEMREWWAVVGKWRANDPRRESILQGVLRDEDAYDLVAQLPLDCAADEAPGYLLNQTMHRPDDVRKYVRDVEDWNERQRKATVTEGGEHMEQLVKDNITEVANVTKVYQNERRRGKVAK